MKFYCLVAVFLFYIFSAYSQTIDTKLPTIAPLSPEAAGLGKYGDVPTTEYTGTPSVNVPLYTVKAGNIEMPLSLNYHATGIQVTQESSWVGLGWNLIAGGVISYVPVGANDQSTPVFNRPWSEWSTFFNMFPYPFKSHEQYLVGWDCVPVNSANKTPDLLVKAMVAGEGEPDTYIVNFLNYSFKFVFHPETGKPYFLSGKNKCKIEHPNSLSWIITTEDGVKYYFQEPETNANNMYTSSWLLTGILTPDGRAIQLRYTNYGAIETLPSLVENYYYNGTGTEQISSGGCGSPEPSKTGPDRRLYTDNTYNIMNKYLSEIESDDELIKFYHSTRNDIKGGSRKLDSMVVFNKLTGKRIRKNQFGYSYFTGAVTGGDYLAQNDAWQTFFGTTYPENFRKYRLKLDTMLEIGSANEKNIYTFKYDEHTPLPYKTSFARDFWGFYNGQENLTSFAGEYNTTIPQTWQILLHDLDKYTSLPGSISNVDGATRFTSSNYITAGMLTEINYPTGGRSVFEYEPHTFNNRYKYPTVETMGNYISNFANSAIAFNSPSQTAGFGFTINVASFVDISAVIKGSGPNGNYTGVQLAAAFVKIVGSTTAGVSFERTYQLTGPDYAAFDISHIKQWRETIKLSPGSYSMYCSFPSALGGQPSGGPQASGNIHYIDFNKPAIDTMQSSGGGVRIKKITNYTDATTIANIKSYSYLNTSNKSSGQQMSLIKLFKQYDFSTSDGSVTVRPDGQPIYAYCRSLYNVYKLFGSSYAALASTPNGNYVGYDRVAISMVDAAGNPNGKQIKYFENIPATLYFDEIPVFDNFLQNGNVKQNIYLKSNGDTVMNEEYKYASLDIANERFNGRGEDMYEGTSNYCIGFTNPLSYNTRFWLYAYNSFSSWVVPEKKTITSFSGTNKLVTTEDYKYDITDYQPIEIKTSLSDGRTKYTRFKYPNDFITDPSTYYSQMVAYNMINPLIMKTVTIAGADGVEKPVESQRNYYDIYGTQLFLSRVQASSGNNVLEDKIVFHNRDAISNVLEQSKKYDVHTSFIWDYNKQYPVAEVLNASYDQIAYTSFEADATGNWTTSGTILSAGGVTGNRSFNGSLTRSANTSVTYTVTLWRNAGATATVNGTTGTQLATKGNWVLLSWKLSGIMNVQVQGTNIDEVRMYPEKASMTTYIYEPSIGVTQKCDQNNLFTYYEYDGLGRLKTSRDNEGNILKTYDYQYRTSVTQ